MWFDEVVFGVPCVLSYTIYCSYTIWVEKERINLETIADKVVIRIEAPLPTPTTSKWQ